MLNREQYERIFRQSYTRYYYLSLQIVGDPDVARDLVSDVFVRLWEQRKSIREATIFSWLFRCIHNSSIDYLRKHPDKNRGTDELQIIADEESWRTEEEQITKMEQIIRQLPERTQQVLRKRYLEDKSYMDVAQDLGISIDGVKKHIVKAFKVLREKMNVKKQ
ncbi:MAG: sigma-70 family RNA polymerase sigma factor [Prevotella sp.]|jgi:RNA polymerase sigma-70 factor (family 1)